MVSAARDILGKGIYTPTEAAFYARIPAQTMSRWVFGSRGAPVITRNLDPDERFVSFLEFVQSLSVKAIRSVYKIPLQRIREAVTEAERLFGLPYPFAMQHTTYLFGDLKNAPHKANVVIRRPGSVVEDLVQISGKSRGNKVMAVVAELHMRDLTMGADGVAAAYTAWERGGRKITMDPHRQFGEPLVGKSGYSASALWHAYVTEGGIENAAKAYDVEPEDVELAIGYYDHLRDASSLRDN